MHYRDEQLEPFKVAIALRDAAVAAGKPVARADELVQWVAQAEAAMARFEGLAQRVENLEACERRRAEEQYRQQFEAQGQRR